MVQTVSVVVPTYNRARYVADTLNSILAQTHPPIEVILVDDGSIDDTATVAEQFRQRVKYIRQENSGPSVARNRGIAEATGTWVAFCDSDDLWAPNKLAEQLAALQRFPECGWCVTSATIIDPDGAPLPGDGWSRMFEAVADHDAAVRLFSRTMRREPFDDLGDVYVGDAFELLFEGNFVLPTTVLMRRDLFKSVGVFDPTMRWAEDMEYFHRLSASSPLMILDWPTVQYRRGHPSTIESGDRTAIIRGAIDSLDRAARLRPLTPSARATYALGRRKVQLRLAYEHLSVLDPRSARNVLQGMELPLTARVLALRVGASLPASLLRLAGGMKRLLGRP